MSFEARQKRPYLIKIYVGGINAISGEPAVEDAGTRLRRQAKKGKGDLPLQDYIVVPGQKWLDGIADSNGTVRQFVAMPFGSGYSVEQQITGKDAAGGIQVEVTPYKPPKPAPKTIRDPVFKQGDPPVFTKGDHPTSKQGDHPIIIRTIAGEWMPLNLDVDNRVSNIKDRIAEKSGIPAAQQRLVYAGKQMIGRRKAN